MIVAVFSFIQSWQAVRSANASVESAKTALASYEATARPYIQPMLNAAVQEKPQSLQFNAVFKNYGTIPAQNVTLFWRVEINGVEIPVSKEAPDKPSVLAPTEITRLIGATGTIESPRIISGADKLLIYTTISYEWRDKHEDGCEKYEYYAPAKNFFNLGPTCYPN